MTLSRILRHPLFAPLTIQIILAYEWFFGGIEKFRAGTFVLGMTKTLTRFESGNPHKWYVDSWLLFAKNNPELFGQLVQWGELLMGIGLVVGVLFCVFGKTPIFKRWARILSLASLIGGGFMNVNFYFAAGWTSASTGGLNVLLFWIEMTLLLFWFVSSRTSEVSLLEKRREQ